MPLDGYLGQIVPFAGNFAPKGWAFCQGQLLSIQANPNLFVVIGTNFGGDGTTTFKLPDLRGRCAVSRGQSLGTSSWTMGQSGGLERVTLSEAQIPLHTHQLRGVPAEGTQNSIANAILAKSKLDIARYGTRSGSATMLQMTVQAVGNSQSHGNVQPSLAINYIICTLGLFPPRP